MKRGATPGERARRQKNFNRVVLVVTLTIIIVVTVYALSRPQGVALPSYLDRCVPLKSTLSYSSSFLIHIMINGVNQTIPSGIGIIGTCIRPIHTYRASGVVYIDSIDNRTYSLHEFFLMWGSSYGETYATFNKGQLFSYQGDANHPIVLKVGNQTQLSYESLPLPVGGDSTTNAPISIIYG